MRLKWPEIPVDFVTAYLSPDVAKTILQEKVIFLPKPLDPGKLMASVERFTSRRVSRGMATSERSKK